jgi:hypothetical protein
MSGDLFETLRGISRDVLEISREVGGFRAEVARELGGVQERLDRMEGQMDQVKTLSVQACDSVKDLAMKQHEHERRLGEVEKTVTEARLRVTGLRAAWATVAAIITVGGGLTLVILRLVGKF